MKSGEGSTLLRISSLASTTPLLLRPKPVESSSIFLPKSQLLLLFLLRMAVRKRGPFHLIYLRRARTEPSSIPFLPAPATKYIPPALRARMLAEAGGGRENDASRRDELARLDKTAKGLLNRMGESNIEGILNEVEGLYRKHARNGSLYSLDLLSIFVLSLTCDWSDLFVRSRRHLLPHQTHPRNHLLSRQPPRLLRRTLRFSRRWDLQDHRSRVWFVLFSLSIKSRPFPRC